MEESENDEVVPRERLFSRQPPMKKDPAAQFTFIVDFQLKLLRSEFKEHDELIDFLDQFLLKILKECENCRSKPVAAGILAKRITHILVAVKEINRQFISNAAYLNRMSRILAVYMDLELKASVKGIEYPRTIINRIEIMLEGYLKTSPNDNDSYILDAFVHMKRLIKTNKEIIDLLFHRYLKNKKGNYKPIMQTDRMYITYLVLFKKWKAIEQSADFRKVIDDMCLRLIKPQPTLRINPKYTHYLPNWEENMDPTMLFLSSKLELHSLIEAIKRPEIENNSFIQVLDLEQLSINVDDDPPSAHTSQSIFRAGISQSGHQQNSSTSIPHPSSTLKSIQVVDKICTPNFNNVHSSSSSNTNSISNPSPPAVTQSKDEEISTFPQPYQEMVIKLESPSVEMIDLTEDEVELDDLSDPYLNWMTELTQNAKDAIRARMLPPRSIPRKSLRKVIEVIDLDNYVENSHMKSTKDTSNTTNATIVQTTSSTEGIDEERTDFVMQSPSDSGITSLGLNTEYSSWTEDDLTDGGLTSENDEMNKFESDILNTSNIMFKSDKSLQHHPHQQQQQQQKTNNNSHLNEAECFSHRFPGEYSSSKICDEVVLNSQRAHIIDAQFVDTDPEVSLDGLDEETIVDKAVSAGLVEPTDSRQPCRTAQENLLENLLNSDGTAFNPDDMVNTEYKRCHEKSPPPSTLTVKNIAELETSPQTQSLTAVHKTYQNKRRNRTVSKNSGSIDTTNFELFDSYVTVKPPSTPSTTPTTKMQTTTPSPVTVIKKLPSLSPTVHPVETIASTNVVFSMSPIQKPFPLAQFAKQSSSSKSIRSRSNSPAVHYSTQMPQVSNISSIRNDWTKSINFANVGAHLPTPPMTSTASLSHDSATTSTTPTISSQDHLKTSPSTSSTTIAIPSISTVVKKQSTSSITSSSLLVDESSRRSFDMMVTTTGKTKLDFDETEEMMAEMSTPGDVDIEDDFFSNEDDVHMTEDDEEDSMIQVRCTYLDDRRLNNLTRAFAPQRPLVKTRQITTVTAPPLIPAISDTTIKDQIPVFISSVVMPPSAAAVTFEDEGTPIRPKSHTKRIAFNETVKVQEIDKFYEPEQKKKKESSVILSGGSGISKKSVKFEEIKPEKPIVNLVKTKMTAVKNKPKPPQMPTPTTASKISPTKITTATSKKKGTEFVNRCRTCYIKLKRIQITDSRCAHCVRRAVKQPVITNKRKISSVPSILPSPTPNNEDMKLISETVVEQPRPYSPPLELQQQRKSFTFDASVSKKNIINNKNKTLMTPTTVSFDEIKNAEDLNVFPKRRNSSYNYTNPFWELSSGDDDILPTSCSLLFEETPKKEAKQKKIKRRRKSQSTTVAIKNDENIKELTSTNVVVPDVSAPISPKMVKFKRSLYVRLKQFMWEDFLPIIETQLEQNDVNSVENHDETLLIPTPAATENETEAVVNESIPPPSPSPLPLPSPSPVIMEQDNDVISSETQSEDNCHGKEDDEPTKMATIETKENENDNNDDDDDEVPFVTISNEQSDFPFLDYIKKSPHVLLKAIKWPTMLEMSKNEFTSTIVSEQPSSPAPLPPPPPLTSHPPKSPSKNGANDDENNLKICQSDKFSWTESRQTSLSDSIEIEPVVNDDDNDDGNCAVDQGDNDDDQQENDIEKIVKIEENTLEDVVDNADNNDLCDDKVVEGSTKSMDISGRSPQTMSPAQEEVSTASSSPIPNIPLESPDDIDDTPVVLNQEAKHTSADQKLLTSNGDTNEKSEDQQQSTVEETTRRSPRTKETIGSESTTPEPRNSSKDRRLNVLLTRTPVKILPVVSCFEQIEINGRSDEKKITTSTRDGNRFTTTQHRVNDSNEVTAAAMMSTSTTITTQITKRTKNCQETVKERSITVVDKNLETLPKEMTVEEEAEGEKGKEKTKEKEENGDGCETINQIELKKSLEPETSAGVVVVTTAETEIPKIGNYEAFENALKLTEEEELTPELVGQQQQQEQSLSSMDVSDHHLLENSVVLDDFSVSLPSVTAVTDPENQDVISSTSQIESTSKDHTYFINELFVNENATHYDDDDENCAETTAAIDSDPLDIYNHPHRHNLLNHDDFPSEDDAIMHDYLNEHIVGHDVCSTIREKSSELDRQSCTSDDIPSPPFEKVATSSEDPHLGQTKDLNDDPHQHFSQYNIDSKEYESPVTFNERGDDDEKSMFSDCDEFDEIHINVDNGYGSKVSDMMMDHVYHQKSMSCDVSTTTLLNSKPPKKPAKPRQKRAKKSKVNTAAALNELTETIVSSTTIHNNGMAMSLGQAVMFAGTNHSCFSPTGQRYVDLADEYPAVKRKRGRPPGSKNKKKDPKLFAITPMYNFNRNGSIKIYNRKVCNRRPSTYYNNDVVSPQHPSSTFSPSQNLMSHCYSPPQKSQHQELYTETEPYMNTSSTPQHLVTLTPPFLQQQPESDELPLVKKSLPPQLFATIPPQHRLVATGTVAAINTLFNSNTNTTTTAAITNDNKSTKKSKRNNSESLPFCLGSQQLCGEDNPVVDSPKTYSKNNVIKNVFVPPDVEHLIINQAGPLVKATKHGAVEQTTVITTPDDDFVYDQTSSQLSSGIMTQLCERVDVDINR